MVIAQLASSDMPHSLCPVFQVQGLQLMLFPFEAAPLPKKLLKTGVQSLKRFASEIVAATDAVMRGI